MAYRLNVDMWDWVNPKTQKTVQLRKGDEVPQEVLDQEGVNVEELEKGRFPMFLRDEDKRETGSPSSAAKASAQSSSSSPKVAESK